MFGVTTRFEIKSVINLSTYFIVTYTSYIFIPVSWPWAFIVMSVMSLFIHGDLVPRATRTSNALSLSLRRFRRSHTQSSLI